METYAQLYPPNPGEEDRAFARQLFEPDGIFARLIPCGACAAHYRQYATSHPVDVNSGRGLILWVMHLHNDVNRRTNKPVWTFDQVMESYRGSHTARSRGASSSEPAVRARRFEHRRVILFVAVGLAAVALAAAGAVVCRRSKPSRGSTEGMPR